MKSLPSEARLRSLVKQSITRSVPLDPLLMNALFNGNASEFDSERHEDRRRLYFWTVRLWCQERRPAGSTSRIARWDNPPTLEEAWQVIRMAGPDPVEWWIIPGLTWASVGKDLGMPARVAAYHFCEAQGWQFTGSWGTRLVTRAPCIACEIPWPAQSIARRLCGSCR